MDIRSCFCDFFLVIFVLCIHGGLSNTDDDYEDGPSFGRCPWIRNKLKNGRVKYRYRGRVAKFLCDAGFELAGKRSSTCVRGQWTNPVPVCVARGCSPVPPIPNGRVTEMYRGALLVYDCNPGYTLDGETSIHCNGRRWSTAPPICSVATETPETQCDFESPDLCGWTHDPTHDFDWQRNQFSTPSGHVGTGPAFDHTFGENKAGFYLYIEASSPRKINDTARLFSPVYPEDWSGGCFVLWYHMYGATTGGLRVYLKPESYVFDELKPTWAKYGDQGNQWHRGNIIVPVVHEHFQIVIEGVRGESYVGDSAIDDVWLTRSTCESIENSTETTENTAKDSCRGRCREKESGESCDCNDACFDELTCCGDYLKICGAGNDTLMQSTDEPLPGDYFGKTSSLVTTTSIHTTEKAVEEQITTAASNESTELDSTSKSINVSGVNESTPAKTLTPIETSNFTTHLTTESFYSTTEIPLSSKQPSTISLADTSTNTVYVTSATSTELTTLSKNSASVSFSSTSLATTSSAIPTTSATSSSSVTTTSITTSTATTPLMTESPKGIFQSTTVPTSTPISSTPLLLTSTPITSTTTSRLLYSTGQQSTIGSTNYYRLTTVPLSSPISTVTSTSRTYNLRPRTQRTTLSSTLFRPSTTLSTKQHSSTTNVPLHEVTSTPSTFKTNTPFSTTAAGRFIDPTTSTFKPKDSYSTTSAGRFIASYSTRTIRPAIVTTTERSTMQKLTTSKILYVPKTTIPDILQTTKFAYRITKPTESSLTTKSDMYETGASKSKTSANNGSAPVVIALVVVVIVCVVAGLIYYMKKRRNVRQSKLSDDSEMRFLPESDYNDYSDSSALDRIFK